MPPVCAESSSGMRQARWCACRNRGCRWIRLMHAPRTIGGWFQSRRIMRAHIHGRILHAWSRCAASRISSSPAGPLVAGVQKRGDCGSCEVRTMLHFNSLAAPRVARLHPRAWRAGVGTSDAVEAAQLEVLAVEIKTPSR